MTDQEKRLKESAVLGRIADELASEGIATYLDRDEYGIVGFVVCRNTKMAQFILENTPGLTNETGNSLIITAKHPD
jgi:hypothetical protein